MNRETGKKPRRKKRQTLRRDQILRDKRAIARLFREGKWFSGRDIRLIVLPMPGDHTQVLFCAPRKISRAVDRNRLKRLQREFYRRHQGQISPGWWVGMVPFAGWARRKTVDRETETIRVFRMAGIWGPTPGEATVQKSGPGPG